jgi:TetR/AcrR family tetracycline transcriptional repressor
MSLDRAAIVEAALGLLERDGVDGLSTRKLAAQLGIRGPSLYWHFKSKQQLLDHMAERMFQDALPSPPGADLRGFDRRAWLEAGARGLRQAALSRRDGARVLAGSRPATEAGERAFGEMMETLVRTGFSRRDAAMTLQLLGRFAVGWVLYEQSADPRTPAASETGFEFGLQSLLDGIEERLGADLPLEAARA